MKQTAIAIAYRNPLYLVKHMILNAGLENPAYPFLTVVFVKDRRDIPVPLIGKPVGRKKSSYNSIGFVSYSAQRC